MGAETKSLATSRKNLFLHIGTHKTGSTSIQHFLKDHIAELKNRDFDLYRGNIKSTNHIEIYLSSMRPLRDSFAKQKFKINIDNQFVEDTAQRVQHFIATSRFSNIVFTAEGLSLLRFRDEIERLRYVLGADSHDITIILITREPVEFLESLKKQILKVPNRALSRDPESVFYVEPDSWLADFTTLKSLYIDGFGRSSLVNIDYDYALERDGNILPSFLEVLGLDSADFSDAGKYWKNQSGRKIGGSARIQSFVRKLVGF